MTDETTSHWFSRTLEPEIAAGSTRMVHFVTVVIEFLCRYQTYLFHFKPSYHLDTSSDFCFDAV